MSSYKLLKEALLFFAVLIPITFALYRPALNAPFIFDDTNNIEQNKNIRMESISLETLSKATTPPRPVAMLSFALNYYVHGLSTGGYRITNIIIHLLAAFCLYCIILLTVRIQYPSKKARRRYHWLATVVAFIWCIHPLHIQSVSYIVQRMNSLAALFYLISLLCYICGRLSSQTIKQRLLFFLCFLFCLFALGTKPNSATLPLALLLYEWFFFQKCKLQITRNNLFYGMVIILLFGVVSWILMDGNPMGMLQSWYDKNTFTPFQRVITEFRVVVLYISLILLPHPSRLNIDHDILLSTSLTSPISTGFSLLLLIFIVGFGWVIRKRQSFLAFGIFWFFLNLIIESTIIPLDLIFEHRNYLPSMMLIAGFVSAGFSVQSFKSIRILTVLIIGFLLCFWTYQRNIIWSDPITLWYDSAKKSPLKARPHESLAYYLEQSGKYVKSLAWYKRALQLNPSQPQTLNNIGKLYFKMGEYQTAISYLKQALEKQPQYKEAENNYGNALAGMKLFDEAIPHFEKALSLDPTYGKAHGNLANVFAALNQKEAALKHYLIAIRENPKDATIRYNRAVLLLQTGQSKQAINEFKDVLTLKPDFAAAYNNLGVAYLQQHQQQMAIKYYQKALQVDPTNVDALNNLSALQKEKK